VLIYLDIKEEKTGALLVLSQPDSALIILNGSVIIQHAGEVVTSLKPGNITISAYLKDYSCQPPEFLGVIAVDETLIVNFQLVPAQDTLGEDNEPESTSDLLSDWKENFPASKLNKSVPAVHQEKQYHLRSIVVTSDIKGAAIMVNGVNSGLVTNASLESLSEGSYTVSLQKEGFIVYPKSKNVILDKDYQTEIVHFHLTPATANIYPELMISTEPVEGNIYLDDSLVGCGSFKAKLDLGEYQIHFGEVKNFLTPNPFVIALTVNNPIQMVKAEYIRIIGKSALAIMRLPENGIIEGKDFCFYLDGRPYFSPQRGQRNGFLIDNLPDGTHLIRFEYQGLFVEKEIECQDGEVVSLEFLIERVLNKKYIKVRSFTNFPRSEWLKNNAPLDVVMVTNPNL